MIKAKLQIKIGLEHIPYKGLIYGPCFIKTAPLKITI